MVPLVFKTSLGAVRFPEGSTPSLLRHCDSLPALRAGETLEGRLNNLTQMQRIAAFKSLARRAGAQDVERTLRRTAELLDDVRVDHRRLDMGVAEVLLNLADVHAVEQQVGGKAVAECVHGNGFVDVRAHGGRLDGFLDVRCQSVRCRKLTK